jgi:hypothetical protein
MGAMGRITGKTVQAIGVFQCEIHWKSDDPLEHSMDHPDFCGNSVKILMIH